MKESTRDIKIDKNVPMPMSGYLNWSKIVYKMEIGDSIFVLSDAERNNVRHSGNKKEFKFISRREKEGYRMWRTE